MTQAAPNENLIRRTLRALGLFGGVQGVNVVFSVLRVKLVALWLGPDGMGLFSIFNSAVDMVSSATQLSLRASSVRDITTAGENAGRVSKIVVRWGWLLGVAGLLVMLLTAPLLSRISFGNEEFTWAYRVLSVAVFLMAIQNGYSAVMQGLERWNRLARTQLLGAIGGFLLSVPMFYYWRINSVIPSILVYALTTALFAYFNRVRTDIPQRALGLKETLRGGAGFIRLGMYMTISSFTALAAGYLFIAWLNENSSTESVGFFNAGFTLVNRYIGLILGAVATEYYPRLARIVDDRLETDRHVSTEISVGLKIILPVVLLFIAADKLIVAVLYSPAFEVIIPFIEWAIIGTVFRFVSWCLAYVILARGDGRTYIVTEVLSSAVYLVVNIFAFSRWGIAGMGYAYCIWYFVYTVMVGGVYFFRYGNRLNGRVMMFTVGGVAVSVVALIVSSIAGWWVPALMAVLLGYPALKSLRKGASRR